MLFVGVHVMIHAQTWENQIPNHRFEGDYYSLFKSKVAHAYNADFYILKHNKSERNNLDSLKTFHGLALQYNPLNYYRPYNFGYEWLKSDKEIYLGLGLNTFYIKDFEYSALGFGGRIYIEIGKQFGSRISFDGYYNWKPRIFRIELSDFLAVNRPYRQLFGVAPSFGFFYKNKNRTFQVILSFNFDHILAQKYFHASDGSVVLEWFSPESLMNIGLTLKYNFLTK